MPENIVNEEREYRNMGIYTLVQYRQQIKSVEQEIKSKLHPSELQCFRQRKALCVRTANSYHHIKINVSWVEHTDGPPALQRCSYESIAVLNYIHVPCIWRLFISFSLLLSRFMVSNFMCCINVFLLSFLTYLFVF